MNTSKLRKVLSLVVFAFLLKAGVSLTLWKTMHISTCRASNPVKVALGGLHKSPAALVEKDLEARLLQSTYEKDGGAYLVRAHIPFPPCEPDCLNPCENCPWYQCLFWVC